MTEVFVLISDTNLPMGVYSTLDRAVEAGEGLPQHEERHWCVGRHVLDAPPTDGCSIDNVHQGGDDSE